MGIYDLGHVTERQLRGKFQIFFRNLQRDGIYRCFVPLSNLLKFHSVIILTTYFFPVLFQFDSIVHAGPRQGGKTLQEIVEAVSFIRSFHLHFTSDIFFCCFSVLRCGAFFGLACSVFLTVGFAGNKKVF